MVQLVLSSPKGNQGARYFPYSGYLGLTPVRVDGAVRTRLDVDSKPISARALTVAVRCYETRQGCFSPSASHCLVEYPQTLWTAGDDLDPQARKPEFADLGESQYMFRIVLPTNTVGFSMASFPDYKLTWRVEAILEHANIVGVGTIMRKTWEIPLIRHDAPSPIPRLMWTPPTRSRAAAVLPYCRSTSKSRRPAFRYSLTVPADAIGPEDLVSIPFSLQFTDARMTLRSAHVSVERKMELLEPAAASASAASTSMPYPSAPPTPQQRFGSVASDVGTATSSDGSGSLTPTPSLLTQTTVDMDVTPNASRSTLAPAALTPGFPYLTASFSTISLASVDGTAASCSSQQPLIRAPPSPTSSHSSPSPSPSPLAAGLPAVPSAAAPAVTSVIVSSDISGTSFSHSALGSTSSLPASSESDTWSKTLTVQWPPARSTHRWAVGETMQTDLMRIRFIVRVTVVVSSPGTGTESIELDIDERERELLVVSTNDAQRRLVLAKYSQLAGSKKSKSQSPKRRTRPAGSTDTERERERERVRRRQHSHQQQLPTPPGSPPDLVRPTWPSDGSDSDRPTPPAASSSHAAARPAEHLRVQSASTALSVSSSADAKAATEAGAGAGPARKEGRAKGARSLRRPHTSAGPADVPHAEWKGDRAGSMAELLTSADIMRGEAWRAGASTALYEATVAGFGVSIGSGSGGSRRSGRASKPRPRVEDGDVRAWEEELARIEARSRRSTATMMNMKGRSGSAGESSS